MEGQDGQKAISIDPSTIKTAQDAIGRLDVLVCGNCHTVSHFVEEFLEHKNVAGVCSNASNFRDNGNNEQKAQVWAFLLWKDSQIRKENPDREAAQTESWELYQKWCKMASNIRESWISAGKTIQTFTKLSNAKIPDSPRIINSQTSSPLSSTNETPKQTTMVMRKVMRNGQNEIVDVKKENKIEPPPLVPTNQKVIHNKQQNEQQQQSQQQQPQPQQKQVKKSGPFVRPRCCIVPRYKPGKPPGENEPENTEEFPVEKIMAKRFNTKKRIAEYQIKWEGIHQDFNTWESTDCVYKCKYLLEEFDRNLAKQKEAKALKEALLAQQGQQVQQGKKVVRQAPQAGSSSSTATATIKQEPINKPGPSTATTPGRPPRNSKTKAMDQVKQWCGSMKEEENELSGKRSIDNTDSDDEDAVMHKKVKVEACSDEDWTGESDMDDRSMVGGRSDVIQRAFNRATNVQSNGSNNNNSNNNKTTTATTMVTTTDLSHLINTSSGVQQTIDTTKIQQSPVMVTNSKGVKLDGNKIPQLASGVYMMHKRDGMLKFESASPTGNKMNVKNSQNNITSGGSGGSGGVGVGGVLMVQNRDGTGVVRKQVIGMSTSTTSMTPVKVVSKSDGTQVVTQMKVVAKPGQPKIQQLTPTLQQQQQQQQQHRVVGIVQKNEPVKIQPKPEHQLQQQQQQQQQQVQQLQIVTTVPGQVQPRMSTTPTIRQQTTGQVQRTPQLLPRTNVRGQTPTSVLGTRTQTVRTPISKQQQTMQLQQQRQQQMVQKRIISTNSPQSSPTQTAGGQQLRQKLTVSSSPQGQIVKQQIMTTTTASNSSVVSPMQTKQIQKIAQQKTPTSSTQQSIISPQQKILMAKKKIQAEAAANSSKTTLSPRVGTTTATTATVKTPLQSRVRGRPSTTPQTTTLPKQKETKIVEGDGIHMEFHEVGGSEDESDDIESSQTTTTTTSTTTTTIIEDNCQPPQSESPQPEYSLCPLTGRIIGPDGEPMDTSEPIIVTTQESAQTTTIPITISTPMSIQTTDVITTSSNLALSTTPTVSLSLPTLDSTPMDTSTTTTTTMQSSTTAEIVMPSLDGISEGGIMRVEMSPGGTSGTVVQTTNNTIQEQTPMEINVEQGLPCLDDTTITTSATATTTTATTTTLETPTTSITEETSILPTLPTTITSSCNITDTNTTINDTINKTIDTTVTTPTSEETTITTATDVALTSATITTTAASTTTTSTSTVTNDDTDNNINNEKTTDIEKTNDDNNTNIVDDGSNLVTITGEDGVVYQVAGQAPDGQTVLVAHGADGEQQCVYVTTDQQVEGGVLTLDHAVAEAVAQLIPDGQGGLQSQFYVKEGEDSNNEQQMVMSIMDSAASGQEDSDSQAQVVAQVVQADEPTPGGTRRVVLLLPDGNLMMTEVDEEQYAALELDK